MKRKSWPEWSEWMPLVEEAVTVPAEPGVYMIGARDQLQRAHGIDPEGILDIGESGNLKLRLSAFLGCARGTRCSGHMAGVRYRLFGYDRIFPLNELWVCWRAVLTKRDAYMHEGELLADYLRQHLELPPLNYKYNWSERIDPSNYLSEVVE